MFIIIFISKIQLLSGVKTRIFRLRHGSELASYLYSEGLISQGPESTDDYLEFRVKMTDEQFARMNSYMKKSGKKLAKT